jgi:hypothetical protein
MEDFMIKMTMFTVTATLLAVVSPAFAAVARPAGAAARPIDATNVLPKLASKPVRYRACRSRNAAAAKIGWPKVSIRSPNKAAKLPGQIIQPNYLASSRRYCPSRASVGPLYSARS